MVAVKICVCEAGRISISLSTIRNVGGDDESKAANHVEVCMSNINVDVLNRRYHIG